MTKTNYKDASPYRCDCGFFATSQVEDDYFGDQAAAPLYATYTGFDPYTCTWPEGGYNPCKDFCQTWANDLVEGGFNLCLRTPEVSILMRRNKPMTNILVNGPMVKILIYGSVSKILVHGPMTKIYASLS